MPYEGQTGTAPDGTRVVYRKGKVYPLDADPGAGGGIMHDVKPDQDLIEDARKESELALGAAVDAGRFVDLNRKVATGPGMGIPLLPLPKFMGESPKVGDSLVAPFSPSYGEMKALTSKMVPRQRVPGSGATSDFESKMFLEGVPSVTKLGTANQAIAKRLQQDSDRAAARAAFLDTWHSKRGSLVGAEAAFKDFWAKRLAGDPVANNVAADAAPPAAPNVFQGKNGTVRPLD